MRVLLIADEAFADRERTLLERLAIGLADEGVRVIRALPTSVTTEDDSGSSALLGTPLSYQPEGFPFSAGARARRLHDTLLERLPSHDKHVNIVHAFGGRAWSVAFELAKQMKSVVALEFWRAGLLRRLKALSPGETPVTLFVPDRALVPVLKDTAFTNSICVAPWGVHAPADLPSRDSPPRSIVLCASGIEGTAVAAAFQAAAEIARQNAGVRLFVDARAARRTALWSRAISLGVTDRVTLVDSVESHRELTLKADVLLLPEPLGEHRSFVLEAMARGVAVLGHRDTHVTHLSSGEEVRLIDKGSVDGWRRAIQGLMDSPIELSSRRRAARDHIQQHHRASAHIAAVLGGYEAALHKPADNKRAAS